MLIFNNVYRLAGCSISWTSEILSLIPARIFCCMKGASFRLHFSYIYKRWCGFPIIPALLSLWHNALSSHLLLYGHAIPSYGYFGVALLNALWNDSKIDKIEPMGNLNLLLVTLAKAFEMEDGLLPARGKLNPCQLRIPYISHKWKKESSILKEAVDISGGMVYYALRKGWAASSSLYGPPVHDHVEPSPRLDSL